MKKVFKLRVVGAAVLAVMVAAGLIAGCASVAKPAARDANAEYELVVLHTNDHHGTTISKDGKMGLAERATFVAAAKRDHQNVLVLDAGDVNTGTALSNMFSAEPDIKAYGAIGYAAVTLGNHEFDKPFSVLQKQIADAPFSWLSANIKRGDDYFVNPYIIQDYEGFRVAVIGLTTLRSLVTARPDKSLTFIPETDAAKEVVKLVRDEEKADIVIILAHIGDVLETADQTTSPALATALAAANLSVDLIIDGHSHTKFEEPKVVDGIPIVSSYEWGKFMGEAVFKIKDGKTTGFSWRPVEITSAAFPPDPGVTVLLKPYEDYAQASLKEVVMKSGAAFEFGNRLPRYRETAAGDLVGDAFTWYVRDTGVPVDFAITNGGGIRAALPAGDITRENVLTMLPFDNFVFVLTLSGRQVKELFEFAATQNQGAGGFPQVSKEARFTLTYDAEGKNGKVSNLTIGGSPVDDNKTYKIATNDFMAGGGDGYEVMTRSSDTFNTSQLLSSVVIDYAKTLPQPVLPATDGRLTVIGGVQP